MLSILLSWVAAGAMVLPMARADVIPPDYQKGVVFKLTQLWPDFLRNRYQSLDFALLDEIDRMYRALNELDRRDYGYRGVSFLHMLDRIESVPGLERVAFYNSGGWDRLTGPAKLRPLRQWIEISEDVRHHRWSRSLVMHELQHGFDALTGWAMLRPIRGFSLTLSLEYRARRAELDLLRTGLNPAQRLSLIREEGAKRTAGPFRANIRFMNRLIAVQSGIDRDVMRENLDPYYLPEILCEMGLAQVRLPNPGIPPG